MDFIPSDDDDDSQSIEDKFEDEEEEIEEEEEIQEDEPPPKPPQEEIIETIHKIDDIFSVPKEVKLTKKGKPRKQRPPMSEEHKEKLKKAREKAMAVRKKNAQEKKDAKALDKEEKELLKKQKVKRVKQLKEEVDEVAPTQPIKKQEPIFTKKDLEDAQLSAIMNYEKIRKSRKEQKKIEAEKNKEEEALKAQLRRAVAPAQKEYNNYFDGCY